MFENYSILVTMFYINIISCFMGINPPRFVKYSLYKPLYVYKIRLTSILYMSYKADRREYISFKWKFHTRLEIESKLSNWAFNIIMSKFLFVPK